ncbi:MAG: VIT1/CCC1 transporter family protein [Planctomycetota bacterium]|jgi:VIT1/CCC1 family predicted Fe2+/Mn2+ transporter
MDGRDHLSADHTPDAIARRVAAATQHSYLGDGVLGAIDGTVTTFAIVAAAAGAGFSGAVALVFGLANVLADGFSMAVSNYLRAKSDRQIVERARAMEAHHIETIPEGEREEIRHVFAAKGFEGKILDEIVDVITRDRERWIDTMITEELGLPLETPLPVRAGITTFVAFMAAGLVPLIALWAFGSSGFLASTIATAATFFTVGLVKARVLGGGLLASGFETLLIGGGAAVLAYSVAAGTKGLVG